MQHRWLWDAHTVISGTFCSHCCRYLSRGFRFHTCPRFLGLIPLNPRPYVAAFNAYNATALVWIALGRPRTDRDLTRGSIKRRSGAHHGSALARTAHPAIRIGGIIRRDFNMVLEHGQDRAYKGHLRESLGNAIGDEISRLKRLRIEIEFERAFLTRWTYGFQDALRMLVSNASPILQPTLQFHTPRDAGPASGA
jgi:hypothetical protein